MKRLNLMVPDSQYEWLYRTSAELDVSVAEIVRRALEHWISIKTGAAEGPRISDPDASDVDLKIPAELGKTLSEAFKMMEYVLTRQLTPEEHAELESHAGREIGRAAFTLPDPELDEKLGDEIKSRMRREKKATKPKKKGDSPK